MSIEVRIQRETLGSYPVPPRYVLDKSGVDGWRKTESVGPRFDPQKNGVICREPHVLGWSIAELEHALGGKGVYINEDPVAFKALDDCSMEWWSRMREGLSDNPFVLRCPRNGSDKK